VSVVVVNNVISRTNYSPICT